MGSINAERVANKVSETILRGEKVDMGDIIHSVGYSKSTSEKPELVTNTQSYQKALAINQKPLLERLKKEIDRIEQAIAEKNLKGEEYRVLIGSLDILIKNYQLLSGGATERQVFILPTQVLEKNIIPINEPPKQLENGST